MMALDAWKEGWPIFARLFGFRDVVIQLRYSLSIILSLRGQVSWWYDEEEEVTDRDASHQEKACC